MSPARDAYRSQGHAILTARGCVVVIDDALVAYHDGRYPVSIIRWRDSHAPKKPYLTRRESQNQAVLDRATPAVVGRLRQIVHDPTMLMLIARSPAAR